MKFLHIWWFCIWYFNWLCFIFGIVNLF